MRVKLNNVQALRAYGALAVAMFHTGYIVANGRPFGPFGVQIFFVISGFAMAYTTSRNAEGFLVRRIIRVVPLYWMATLLLFLLSFVAPHALNSTPNLQQFVKSLLFIPFVKHDGLVAPLLFPGWSLNFEVLFYVLIALALLFSKRYCALTGAISLGALALALTVADGQGIYAEFYSRLIVLDYLAGALTYEIFRRADSAWIIRNRHALAVASMLAAVSLPLFAMFTDAPVRIPAIGVAASVAVLGAVLLDRIGFSIRWQPVILLGDSAFAVYLSHGFVHRLLIHISWRAGHALHPATRTGMPLAVCLSALAGILLLRYVDRPMQRWLRARFASPIALEPPPLAVPAAAVSPAD